MTLLAAGDIADCEDLDGARRTARLIRTQPDDSIIVTIGDNSYKSGSAREFRCYDRTWGAFRERTHPAAGNHDWNTPGAAGYRAYFGDRAGPDGVTWYAFDAGGWRIVVLDSDCDKVGGCGPESPQGRWLAAELARPSASGGAAPAAACQIAVWHHPFVTSGLHGSITTSGSLWDAVFDAGFDIVLNGHDHHYERFAPLDRAGLATTDDLATRPFIVGTGGARIYGILWPREGSEARAFQHGVLRLDLSPDSYRWQFLAAPDGEVLDEGTGRCR